MNWYNYYDGKIDVLNAIIDDLVDLYEDTDKSIPWIKVLIDSYLEYKDYCERERKLYER